LIKIYFKLLFEIKDVIEFYREKVDNLRSDLLAKLKEEKDEMLLDKMEKEV
jgi:hypothetical protein